MTAGTGSLDADKEFGERASVLPFWEAIYRACIPGFDHLRADSRNNAAQHLGIDDLVVLRNGDVIKIQKKARRPPLDGSDVALEWLHVYRDGAKKCGWIEERSPGEHFLAYGFPHLSLAYVFPRMSLLLAWEANRKDWLQKARESQRRARLDNPNAKFGKPIDSIGWCRSPNPPSDPVYWTHSVIVPTRLLIAAVADTMTVQLAPELH